MSLYIAGGYEEQGRNCFLIEERDYNIMIDCGIMNGSDTYYPELSIPRIKRTKYLFITHSHNNHAGALNFLYQNGFKGTVLLSKHTYFQLKHKPEKFLFIEDLKEAMNIYVLENDFAFMWGKSGHCIGSVWYWIFFFGKSYLFTGDYYEHSSLYQCNKIRDLFADIAVIDCAYGSSLNTENAMDLFKKKVYKICASSQKVLFPVPNHGRGTEIYMILKKITSGKSNLFAEQPILEPMENMEKYMEWIRPDIINSKADNNNICLNEICFIADSQLSLPKNQKFAEKIITEKGTVIFTGNIEKNSFAKSLLETGKAEFIRFPIHQGLIEANKLSENNRFRKKFLVNTNERLVESNK